MTTSLICIWTSNSIRLPYDFTILTPKAHPRCVQMQKAWLMGIVPVVMDCESTVQEKALECLDQLLLQNIKHYNKFHRLRKRVAQTDGTDTSRPRKHASQRRRGHRVPLRP